MDTYAAIGRYTTAKDNGLNTESTVRSYRKTLYAFAQANRDVLDVTEDDLVEFITAGAVSTATMAARRTRLMGFFGWLFYCSYIEDDPSHNLKQKIKIMVKPTVKNNWLTEKETRTVIQSVDTDTNKGLRDRVILSLGFTAGLRRSEIAGLTWGDVNLDRSEIYLIGKGGKASTIFLTPATVWALALLYERGPERRADNPVVNAHHSSSAGPSSLWGNSIKGRTVNDVCTMVSNQVGIPFRAHDMRRTFAALLQAHDVALEDISAALRHSDVGTTQRYLERRQDAAYQAVKKVGLSL